MGRTGGSGGAKALRSESSFPDGNGRRTGARCRRLLVSLGVLGAAVLGSAVGMGQTASAAPASCFAAAVGVVANVSPAARVGDSVDFAVQVFLSSMDCSISKGTVTLTLPNGTVQTLATGVSLGPGGSAVYDEAALSLPEYVVSEANVSPTTDLATASATINATATQTNPPGTDPVSDSASTNLLVIRPETTLTKSVLPTGGAAPLPVTYTFTEQNVSPDTASAAITEDDLTNVSVSDSDSNCTPNLVSSSNNDTSKLDVGASWTFTCTETLSTVGTFTDTATATGLAGDGRQAGTPTSQGAPATETSNMVSVTTTKLPSTTTTNIQLNGSNVSTVSAGSTVTDQATVAPTTLPGVGTPTGSVSFSFYSTSNCSGTATAAGTNVALVGGVANSSSEGPLAAGSYSFLATYGGDGNYQGSTGPCETLTVLAPGLSISKTADATPVSAGSNIGFTVVVSNSSAAGTGTAMGVTLNDPLPAGTGVD